MQNIINILQTPVVRALVAPLGTFIFGGIVGAFSGRFNFTALLLLTIFTINNAILERLLALNKKKKNTIILLEAVNLICVIFSMVTQHFIVTLLLVIYILNLHIIMLQPIYSNPLRLTNLTIQNGLSLNAIAFFTQTGSITPKFLVACLPIMLLSLVIGVEESLLFRRNNLSKTLFYIDKYKTIILLVIIGICFYLSLPSKSYYIVQIIFTLLAIGLLSPVVSKSPYIKSMDNYLYSVTFLINLLYAISYLC